MEKENKKLSVRKQCELLALNRSSLYYEQVGLSEEEQRILREMDKIYLDFPSYGSRRMGRELRRRGYRAGRLKVRNLMRLLGIEAIYPRKRLSLPATGHQIYLYFLQKAKIDSLKVILADSIAYIRGMSWQTIKHYEVYNRCYETVAEYRASIGEFISKYNEVRLHQSLGVYDTPFEAYYQLPAGAAC